MNKSCFFLSFIFSFCALNLQGAAQVEDLTALLRNPSTNCLHGKKIVLTVERAPNHDVPSTGAGDCLFYPRILREKLTSLGASDVAVDLGGSYKWLGSFFAKCTDTPVLSAMNPDQQQSYTPLEVRDVLDAIPDLATFVSRSRFLPQTENCTWANQEVDKVITGLLESQISSLEETGIKQVPVLLARQSAGYNLEGRSQEDAALFGYLNRRSISREELAAMLENAPQHVDVYNIQLEDQQTDAIPGTKKPVLLYDAYAERNGAFVNDAILMAAVIKMGGQIASICSAPLNLAIGIPDETDTRLSIKALLGKHHNSRWQKPFLQDNGSVSWSPNVELLVQETADDWSSVGTRLVRSWEEL